MNRTTNTFIILAIVVVTGLSLITAHSLVSDSALAVKKSKGKTTTPSSSTSSSGKLKNLVSCVTTSAKAAIGGLLNQSQVLDCYSQAYGNATGTTNSTVSTLGTGGNSSSTGGGSSGSSSSTSSSHKSHHHSSGSSTK